MQGHGRGTRLGTCLVNAACVVAFVARMNADKFSVMYLILLKSPVHGHGRDTRLGTCLVYARVSWPLLHVRMLMNFQFMYLILLKSAVHGHGRGTRLGTCPVYAPYVMAFVACVNADGFSVHVPDFIEVSCARAWTRHAPQDIPSARAVCRVS